ncbi:MAG: Mrp/NBP35 family ATP-binding protein [Methylocystaceae bacterium]
MAEDKCSGCASMQNGSCASGSCESEKSLLGCFNDIKKVIAVVSGKGGVGKSSVSALIATNLVSRGLKVGVLDADITGPSIPRIFGLTGAKMQASEYGIIPPVSSSGIKVMSINLFLANEDDPVIWRGPMIAGAVNQFWGETDWRDLDYMIVDLPPGTGDVPLTVMQSLPLSGAVIVSSPQELSLMVVKKAIKMASKLNVPLLGLVENMSYAICPHCGDKFELFGQNQGHAVADEARIPFLGSLPWDKQLNTFMDSGEIEKYDSSEVETVVNRLLEQIK